MTNKAIPYDFVKNVMQNGVGRYICQLQRLTLTFCKSHAGSRGMRDFMEQHMVDFTRNNPGVVVYVKPKRHRPPALVAEYLNGRVEKMSTQNMEAEEICKWAEHLRTRSGVQIVRLNRPWHTESPSIQGVWHPFLNKDPSLAATPLPEPSLYRAPKLEASATDMVVEESLSAKRVGDVDSLSSKE